MNTQNIIKVVRWDLVTHKKDYINGILGFASSVILSGLLLGLTSEGDELYGVTLGKFWSVIFTLIWGTMLTGISNQIHTKTQRIAALMLPASMNEKLVGRMLAYILIYPLALLVALMIGDGVQFALNFILHGSNGAALFTPHFILNPVFRVGHFSVTFGYYSLERSVANCLGMIFLLNYGFLCGCLWTKHALLKGIGIFVLGMTVLGFLLAGIGFTLDYLGVQTNFEINEDTASTILQLLRVAASVITLALSAFFIWLGHRKFVNRQVIDTKSRWYGF